ncbi:MAG: catalase [Clostridia bacterium]|nr:catalase [Clostridia bacterium]
MKAIKHFITITKHRHTVIKHGYKAGILFQSLFHDLSKYSYAEFRAGAKYYQGTRSPNEIEREIFGYSSAWLHHKGRNRHHFEHWIDFNPKAKRDEPVKMPIKYVKEMFCDRVAASKIYQGENYTDSHPIEYFMKGKDFRVIHPETSDLIEFWLRSLSEKGEKETFKIIRNTKKY